MALKDELALIATRAASFADPAEAVAGVIAAEPSPERRVYLCAFRGSDDDERVGWLVLGEDEEPITDRALVRDTASIVALCELAEETAGGGDLEELRAQLATLRLTENPLGIEEAETAALALERTIGSAPRVASPVFLDAVGSATRELEIVLGEAGPSPFAAAMKAGVETVELFASDVLAGYKVPLAD